MPGKVIVWMSRHAPLPAQLAELERLFPRFSLVIEKRPFSSASEIIRRFRDVSGDELVAVAPWSVVRELIKLGIKPIYAEMVQVGSAGDADTTIITGKAKKKRFYKFQRFVYCTSVSLKFEEIPPAKVDLISKPTVLLNPDGTTKSIIK